MITSATARPICLFGPVPAKPIAVGASPKLQLMLKDQGIQVEHLAGGVDQAAYMKALRPHQWLKNILVFLPILAAQNFSLHAILASMLAFAAFSLVSSAGYMLNDLMDLRADRAHPRKSARPLASGRLPIAHGTAMVPALLVVGLTLAALANWQTCGVIALYFGMTTLYSVQLKQLAIADIGTLAALYTMRIIAGGLATGIEPSVWLLAFSIFFFFSLAAVKRQAELVDLGGRGIPTARRRGYNVDDLPMVSQITITSGYVSVMVLALYLNSPGGDRALHHALAFMGDLPGAALLDQPSCASHPSGPDAMTTRLSLACETRPAGSAC